MIRQRTDPMTQARALPPHAFLEAFPFHLWIDEELRVVQVGAAIQRLIPTLVVGAYAFEAIELLRPTASLDAAGLRSQQSELFVVEDASTDMRLRGQLMAMDDGSLVFLLAPWITELDELDRWGLSLADFPIHTAMPDQLALIRSLRASLDDTRRMAERLEHQRRALLESQHRIATHLRQMPLAIIDWDTEGRVATWNPAAATIFGVPVEHAIGQGVEILRMLGPTDGAGRRRDARGIESFDLLAALNQRVIVEHQHPDGGTVLCAWHNTPLIDVAGNPIGVSSILRNVTESVRAERALLENQRLESLGLLAGGVAHDFNNLLAAMIGNADLAMLESGPNSPIIARLEEITAIAERATGLTRQLLDYSGRASYEMKPLELGELIDQMRGLLAVTLSKKIRLVIAKGFQLPPVSGDAGQLRQVLMNLVINGSEAIGDRSGEIRLTTARVELREPLDDASGPHGGALAPGVYLRLEVSDDGLGMSPDVLARIFDPFFSTKFTGRGLGLAAILGIVRGHRGALRVASELGQGTRFEIYFPALERPAPRPIAARPNVPLPGKGRVGRLLIVDDEAQVRRMLSLALRGAGFEVVAAEAGNIALELFEADPQGFDLALTDLTMPGLDGHELFNELTARDPAIRVILSSGYTDHKLSARYPDGTPATFLKKPYRLSHLLAKVHEELGIIAPPQPV